MKLEVDVSGLQRLSAQLADLTGDANDVMLEVVTRVANDTRKEAVQGIQRGPASGRARADGSRASAPGQYPMSDTGRLANGVVAKLPTAGSMSAMVGTNIVYGRYLEFGTSRMAARPWLLRSFNTAKTGVEKRLKKAIEARI